MKDHQSAMVKMIQAETQPVLNINTEHNFQDAFTKWHNRWEQYVHTHMEWDYLEGDRLEVSFWLDGSTSPKNFRSRVSKVLVAAPIGIFYIPPLAIYIKAHLLF